MQVFGKILTVLGAVFAGMGVVAVIKKPGSVYRSDKEQQNPLEGKRVCFVENEEEPANARQCRWRARTP